MGLLAKIVKWFRGDSGKAKKIYVLIGDDKKEYMLIDGKLIPKEKILQIDTNTGKIVYVDLDNTIKVSRIEVRTDQRQESRVPEVTLV